MSAKLCLGQIAVEHLSNKIAATAHCKRLLKHVNGTLLRLYCGRAAVAACWCSFELFVASSCCSMLPRRPGSG